jgi:hypothetical protein
MAPEDEQGAGGAVGTGATGATTPEPESNPESGKEKSINSQAKELPWVQKALAAEARLQQLEAEQAEAKQKAEQAALEQKGQYEQALQMEKDRVAKIEADHKAKVKELSLKTELATAGFRTQATKLFIDEFNPDEKSAADFVAEIKADENNAWLLVQQKTRTPNPTKPGGKGPAEEFDPSWIDSDDPKKREAAVEHNRKAFWEKFHGKGVS